jgi:hypothetical protein
MPVVFYADCADSVHGVLRSGAAFGAQMSLHVALSEQDRRSYMVLA